MIWLITFLLPSGQIAPRHYLSFGLTPEFVFPFNTIAEVKLSTTREIRTNVGFEDYLDTPLTLETFQLIPPAETRPDIDCPKRRSITGRQGTRVKSLDLSITANLPLGRSIASL